MKTYIVFHGYSGFEPGDIIGAYSTLELAISSLGQVNDLHKDYYIEVWIIDEVNAKVCDELYVCNDGVKWEKIG